VKLREDHSITKVIDNIARCAIASVPHLVVVLDCDAEDEMEVMPTLSVNAQPNSFRG
jgi:hypothetical protein